MAIVIHGTNFTSNHSWVPLKLHRHDPHSSIVFPNQERPWWGLNIKPLILSYRNLYSALSLWSVLLGMCLLKSNLGMLMQCHCTSKGFLDNPNTQGSQCTRLRAVEVGQGVCKYTSKGDRNCARPVHWGTLTGAKHFATENKTLVDPKSNSLACQSNVLINQLLSFTTCTRLQLRQFEGVDF